VTVILLMERANDRNCKHANPTYYAVIFTSHRTEGDKGYGDTG